MVAFVVPVAIVISMTTPATRQRIVLVRLPIGHVVPNDSFPMNVLWMDHRRRLPQKTKKPCIRDLANSADGPSPHLQKILGIFE